MKLMQKIGIGIAAITAGIVMAPGTAVAAAWTPISGTAYSNGNWFTSTNVRTKSGTTSVQAQFSTLPANGLKFYIKNYNSGAMIGSIKYFPPSSAQTLASSVGGGTQFVTVFALVSSGGSQYNFSGSLYY
jgi:hypothetical protein